MSRDDDNKPFGSNHIFRIGQVVGLTSRLYKHDPEKIERFLMMPHITLGASPWMHAGTGPKEAAEVLKILEDIEAGNPV